MRLLFDQNLSPRLVAMLADLHPGSTHVRNEGLQRADDDAIWTYALHERFVIVSKDADFHQRSFVLGPRSSASGMPTCWRSGKTRPRRFSLS